MNIKMAINSQLSTTESKKQSKQAEQKHNHRCGHHLEGYHLWKEENGRNVQGSVQIGRYKRDRGMLRTV